MARPAAQRLSTPVSATPPTVVGWQAVGNGLSGAGANPRVFQLVKDTAGNLYAGGSFTGGLSKWTGSGDWATLGNGVGGGSYPWVYALGLDESATPDELYVGGAFTKVNGTATNSPMLAKVTTDTGTWTAIPGVSSTSVEASDGVEEIAVESSSARSSGCRPTSATDSKRGSSRTRSTGQPPRPRAPTWISRIGIIGWSA